MAFKCFSGNQNLLLDLTLSFLIDFFFMKNAPPDAYPLLSFTVVLAQTLLMFFALFFWSWQPEHLNDRIARYFIRASCTFVLILIAGIFILVADALFDYNPPSFVRRLCLIIAFLAGLGLAIFLKYRRIFHKRVGSPNA
jgi:hypothetical protein